MNDDMPSDELTRATIREVLSPRELEVAQMLVRGFTNREIAAALAISVKTVDTHRGNALRKLELRNNVALALRAVREGLVTP